MMQNALGKGGEKVNDNDILGIFTVSIDRLVLIFITFHEISELAVQKHTEHLDSD
jgi:hypothetical protein